MKAVSTKLEAAIKAVALPQNKVQQTKYMKNKVEFYGVKSPGIKEIFRQHWQSDIKALPLKTQLKLSNFCINHEYFEFRSLGMLLLEKHIKDLEPTFLQQDLKNALINSCHEWATCDGLCKIIRLMVARDNDLAQTLLTWKDSDNIWVQRAACVSFVCLVRQYPSKFDDVVFEICGKCVQNNERFVQLGAGWVLRELSVQDLDRTVSFIKKNYDFFSREGLRYAIEKMDAEMKNFLSKYDADAEDECNGESGGNGKSPKSCKSAKPKAAPKTKKKQSESKTKSQSKSKTKEKKEILGKRKGSDAEDEPPKKRLRRSTRRQ